MKGRWVLVLTNSERMALIDLLVEHTMNPSSTQEFHDIGANVRTTPGDLIGRIARSWWFSDFPPAKTNNSAVAIPEHAKG